MIYYFHETDRILGYWQIIGPHCFTCDQTLYVAGKKKLLQNVYEYFIQKKLKSDWFEDKKTDLFNRSVWFEGCPSCGVETFLPRNRFPFTPIPPERPEKYEHATVFFSTLSKQEFLDYPPDTEFYTKPEKIIHQTAPGQNHISKELITFNKYPNYKTNRCLFWFKISNLNIYKSYLNN